MMMMMERVSIMMETVLETTMKMNTHRDYNAVCVRAFLYRIN
jgi:hypothetical protein